MAKTRIDVIPFESFFGIRFGTSKEDVRKVIGEPEFSFLRGTDDNAEADEYSCFQLNYDGSGNLDTAEVISVSEADIYYDGKKVPETYDGALKFFRDLYDDVEEDGSGFYSVKGSIGVFVEDEDEYDAILFARKGFYNDI